MRNISLLVFIILLLLCIGHAAYYYPLLPDRVASHFGASGQPDAWSSKESFVKIYFFVIAFIAVLFPGIGLILGKIPASLINLPNKDHWLSPERREETIAVLIPLVRLGNAPAAPGYFPPVLQSASRQGPGPGSSHNQYCGVCVFPTFWSIALIVKFMRRP